MPHSMDGEFVIHGINIFNLHLMKKLLKNVSRVVVLFKPEFVSSLSW